MPSHADPVAAAKAIASRALARRKWWVRALLLLAALTLTAIGYAWWTDSPRDLALAAGASAFTLGFAYLTGRAHGRALRAVKALRDARKAARAVAAPATR